MGEYRKSSGKMNKKETNGTETRHKKSNHAIDGGKRGHYKGGHDNNDKTKRFEKTRGGAYGAEKPQYKKKEEERAKKDYVEEEREYNENQLEGRNAVLEVLKTERDIEKLFIQSGNVEGTIKRIMGMAKEKGIVIQESSRQKLDQMSQTKNHQGVIALVSEHAYVEIADILQIAKEKDEKPFILVLDGITDPHNFGAILRTAETAGVHGVIIPKRRSVGLTATVGRTSAGAMEHMPVAKVTNIANTLDILKEEGLWVACADMKGLDFFDSDMKGALALVIGNEGDGVSRLVQERCDFTVAIPMYGKIDSLNASVASALLMYEVVRQRKFV